MHHLVSALKTKMARLKRAKYTTARLKRAVKKSIAGLILNKLRS
jgi:hypothetical protein